MRDVFFIFLNIFISQLRSLLLLGITDVTEIRFRPIFINNRSRLPDSSFELGSHRQIADEAAGDDFSPRIIAKRRDISPSLRSLQPLRAIEGHSVSRLLTFRFMETVFVLSRTAGHEKKKKVVNTTACRSNWGCVSGSERAY